MLHAFIGVGLFCLPDSRGQSASVPGRIWLFERRSACRVHACAKTGASTFNPRHSALDIRYHGLFHFFAAPVQPPARTRLQDRLPPACGPRADPRCTFAVSQPMAWRQAGLVALLRQRRQLNARRVHQSGVTSSGLAIPLRADSPMRVGTRRLNLIRRAPPSS
jgi:hypothetical protein